METNYQKYVKEQIRGLSQPETSIPSVYKGEFSLEEKENILKDIYSCIKLFDLLIDKAKQESRKR